MNRVIALALSLSLLLFAGVASTEELAGKKIKIDVGEFRTEDVPVAIAYDGAAPTGRIVARHTRTGKESPAMLRDGELTIIAEGGLPKTEHLYLIEESSVESLWTPHVVVKKQADADVLDVLIDDELFTSYHYSNDNKKPFLWPVNSADGVGVTRDYPMHPEDTPNFAQDHPHHKSVWTSYGDVNGADCWDEGDKAGYQRSDDVTWGSGDAYGWIRAKNTWQNNDKEGVVTETREYRFYATPEKARLFDVHVTFTADFGDAKFGDTKEGGLVAVRMRPELSYKNAVITNSHGDVGEAKTWGKPAPWCDYSGEMEDIGWRGLAVFDHPTNLRHPTSWHVRGYGLMGANCFGYSYFGEKKHNEGLLPAENGDYTIPEGERLDMNYRVYVHSGDVEKADVAERYADFATPPTINWAE